ncbi:interleukin-6 [Peromyscus maniculatus bairdii]|uniref:Interleukin-6 n=1 Tax=Peromyscus maniculatus bairdii TaxID=230844 RepID=A0A6I9M247_PERMB|nr:interleukin-6 [Peromyscus maniculatus bairdii]
MKFLSARDLHPLAFLGLLLAMATALPTSQVRRGDFTEDTTPNRPVYTTSQQVGGLITYILREIFEMRQELCNSDPDCMANDDALSENHLELPEIQTNDGCYQTGYNREICLLKITSGLLDYQIYLEFVKNNVQDNKKDKARALQSTTRTLNQIFKQEVKDSGKIVTPSPTSKALLMEKLESQKEWSRTKTIQLILKALEQFLKVTMRSTRQN